VQTSFGLSRPLWAAFLWAVAQTACADPLPQDELSWLKTIAYAAHRTDYSGTFVYQYGSHVEASRITHISDKDGEHERLESLDGTRREIIRNNDQVWIYQGDDRKPKFGPRLGGKTFPALLPEQLSVLGANYVMTQSEEGRVAGFHVHMITFQPKDNLRFTRKMWAHNDSGLLLKSAVLDDRGHMVEQYTFTELTIGDAVERRWLESLKNIPDNYRQMPAAPKAGSAPLQATGWKVDALPAGFKKIVETNRQLRGHNSRAVHMVFTDGLAAISIFIESAQDRSDVTPGLSSQGAMQIFSKITNDGRLITVVGDVPPQTAMQVADSVRYAGR